jgi:shikimate 5-dehydrogenase
MLDYILENSLAKTVLYGFAFCIVYSFVTNKFIYKKCVKDYRNKHVVITGGSAGLGKAIALKVAQLGGKVTIIARNPQRLDAARAEIDVSIKKRSLERL